MQVDFLTRSKILGIVREQSRFSIAIKLSHPLSSVLSLICIAFLLIVYLGTAYQCDCHGLWLFFCLQLSIAALSLFPIPCSVLKPRLSEDSRKEGMSI